MSIVTVSDVRTYGPGAAFTNLTDGQVQFYIDAAESQLASYIGSRGYEALTAADNDYKLSILKVVTWDLMVGCRGVNPADPAHAALKMSRDEAVAWWKDVQKGTANISGATPARKRTGTARVFSTGSGSGTRGF
jgi:hypothetical protein